MKLTEENVRYVAGLANLTLSESEIHQYADELSNILTYVDKLNELDTTGVEPMAQVLFAAGDPASLREGVQRTPLTNAEALGNAPLATGGYFKVPKVIER
ncbi:MAG: Asp-tRNA(Asn)/Glu-tRNA(Gln) amidotransferase subunit GatC [Acidobacteria bacterium]|nr:Asp-tRNA(Asn)/Glu-tRNA(Gln) amidotransferase subunit GatC [Acidobacteriota bacterium]